MDVLGQLPCCPAKRITLVGVHPNVHKGVDWFPVTTDCEDVSECPAEASMELPVDIEAVEGRYWYLGRDGALSKKLG